MYKNNLVVNSDVSDVEQQSCIFRSSAQHSLLLYISMSLDIQVLQVQHLLESSKIASQLVNSTKLSPSNSPILS